MVQLMKDMITQGVAAAPVLVGHNYRGRLTLHLQAHTCLEIQAASQTHTSLNKAKTS